METDGANQRRQIDSSEQAVEAMDTQESDIVNETTQNNQSPRAVATEDATMQVTNPIENKNNATFVMEDGATTDPIPVGTPATAEEYFGGLAEDALPENHEDDIRSEAVFSFTVNDFSKIKDSTLSPPTMVRNLPWRIMVMPRQERNTPEAKSLGFFLQCNGESESTSWSCNAAAELRLRSFKPNQEPFVRKIKHLFYSKENDWGFSYFISWNEIFDPEKGYVQNDSIVLEVHVVAEAPHGVFWDSKKHTGYVGLRNQGATCYMNSLLQTLYFTNQLRKAVYKMPTEADDSSKSVGLALQRVFHDLQVSDKPVGTRKLTKSFGWETLDSFMQHDVQEFLRVLLDKLESKMKGTCVEGTVPRLFEGKMSSYIKCKNVDYSSTRCETFYDIQLNIKGKKNIYESFQDYIAAETLEGDNKYDAAIHGLQEAEKGVIFTAFPPVLHLHLMRFQYDPITDNSVKFNDRFEFYEQINLDRFLETKESTPADYKLHAVLVHSGDNHGGHYVVYINPMADGEWCKFDDDVVSTCTKTDAIDHNYGGMDDEMAINAKHCSNAYMLVYIRVAELPNVLEEITQRDIPTELFTRLTEEKRLEQARRKERNEHSMIINVNVHLEDTFESHQSPELFDTEKTPQAVFRIKKTQPLSDFLDLLVDAFKIPLPQLRIWPLAPRTVGQKFLYFDVKEEHNRLMSTIVDGQGPWVIFLERAQPNTKDPLPPFDKRNEIFVFLKFYDPVYKRLDYIGHRQYPLNKRLCDIFPDVNFELGYDSNTELAAYEECSANVVQKLINPTDPLEKMLSLSRDDLQGNIIIFEKKHVDEKLELPTVEDYFRDLLYRIEILFVDKTNPNDPGFPIEISNRYTYYQMAQAVAQKINADPHRIQFFKCLAYKDTPGSALRCMYDGNIKDLLSYGKPRTTKKIFYQKLSMNINELENKKQFKCLWLTSNLKDEKEITLFPNKNANVKHLLEEASKTVEFSENGTRKLRLLEIATHKILLSPKEDTLLETLQSSNETMTNQQNLKSYRIEEIPAEELSIAENEMLIPVSHFTREVFNSFGIPFFIKAKQDEPYADLKERIQKRLGVPDKEWEKFKFAIVNMTSVDYINDDKALVNLDSYRLPANSQPGSQLPYFGLEHINKTQKRGRYSYLEKAIKIYN